MMPKRKFLEKYYPEADVTSRRAAGRGSGIRLGVGSLKEPMPVPLDKIAEEMGLPPINYEKHLSPDFSVFGKICFAEEEIDVYDIHGNHERIATKRGQVS